VVAHHRRVDAHAETGDTAAELRREADGADTGAGLIPRDGDEGLVTLEVKGLRNRGRQPCRARAPDRQDRA
jgi:hypothetical protein